jgi:hypothetical protein
MRCSAAVALPTRVMRSPEGWPIGRWVPVLVRLFIEGGLTPEARALVEACPALMARVGAAQAAQAAHAAQP